MPGAGTYGGQTLNAAQYGNAVIITGVGNKMGASARDIQVALMTAMTESSLTNLPGGDRDSAGLFQQRPSQGWGTYAQITHPEYAATQFFNHLFAIPNRDSLSPQMEAQTVQRSAFSDGRNYAPFSGMATALEQDILGTVGQIPGQVTGSLGGNPFSGVSDALGSLGSALSGFSKVTTWLTLPNHWMRIFSGGFGIVLVFMGVMMLSKEVRRG